MKRQYKAGGVANAPPAPPAPSEGYPTEGDVLAGTPATVPGAHWFHMVTEAIVTVIEKAGLVPSNAPTQFRDAVAALGSAPGDIKMTAAAVPDGWLECDGRALNRATYAALFAAIGVAYGAGDNRSTFNLPDFRGRAVIGSGDGGVGLTGRSRGDKGGSETHRLTVNEMPAHTHSSARTGRGSFGTGLSTTYAVNLGSPFETSSTGGGAAHNNMQPFGVARYVIKT